MRVLALDISTKTGIALLCGNMGDSVPELVSTELVQQDQNKEPYPWNYLIRANQLADKVVSVVSGYAPDVIVIEELNSARARLTQKLLSFLHCMILQRLREQCPGVKVAYISTSAWRKVTQVALSKQDKDINRKINQGKSKKELGVKGKKTTKHVSVRVANEMYGKEYKTKDNDITDAILLGVAYFRGAPEVTD